MERTHHTSTQPSRLERQMAHLKIVSRLLGHELHAQTSPRLTLSREEVVEIQTSIDLFIEDVLKSKIRPGTASLPTASAPAPAASETEIQAVPSRMN